MPMFSQYHNSQGYPMQQNWMEQVNMGNPYYSGSPYFNAPTQLAHPTSQNYHMNPAYYQQPNNGSWNYQPTYPPQTGSPLFGGKETVLSVFQNPLEPKDPYGQNMNTYQMNYNPYPKTNMIPRPNGGLGNIMNSFKGQDGNIDLNKMMNTAGQMMNAVSQVSAMVKGLGGMFKV